MTNESLKEAAVAFLTLVASGDVRKAFDLYVGSGFRHHNPFFRGDGTSLMEAMEANAKQSPHKVFVVKQTLQDGDRVAVFSHIRQRPDDRGAAVVHIFRFEAGKIVEGWDVGQAIPEETINANGMF